MVLWWWLSVLAALSCTLAIAQCVPDGIKLKAAVNADAFLASLPRRCSRLLGANKGYYVCLRGITIAGKTMR